MEAPALWVMLHPRMLLDTKSRRYLHTLELLYMADNCFEIELAAGEKETVGEIWDPNIIC